MVTCTQNAPKGRAIITRGRNLMAFVIAHSLHKQGIECIGCDSVDFTLLSFSKTVQEHFVHPAPDVNEPAYIDYMRAKIKAFRPEDNRPYVLIPSFKDMVFFARHRAAFEDLIQIAAPDIEAIEKIHTKDALAKTVKKLDISSPQCWLPQSAADIDNLADKLQYPLFVKPYDECSGRGVKKAECLAEAKEFFSQNLKKFGQKSVLQQAAVGHEYCYCAIYDQGVRKAGMAYKNLYNFPSEAGSGAMRESIEEGAYAAEADKLMKALKWNGVAEFDFIWDEDKDHPPQLLEVNSRFWSGLYQSVESGIDFPTLLYQLTVEGSLPEIEQKAEIGKRTKLPYIWLISAMEEVFSKEERTKELEEIGAQALERMKGGEFWEGLKDFTNYAGDYTKHKLDFSPQREKLDTVLKLGKSARNEILDSDDPLAAFGVLFILGSLWRHGRLPREIQF
jgi:predicted ATP-grasp superfamily ATP-dependent carboligase